MTTKVTGSPLRKALFATMVFCAMGQSSQSEPVWKVSPTPFLEPGPSGTFSETAVKDPSVVFHDGYWHVFFTARGLGGYSIGYASSEYLSLLNQSQRFRLDRLRGTSEDYAAAPQVFYFAPQRKWFLIHQTRDGNYQPCYSTSESISNPEGWSKPRPLLEKTSPGKWIDFWVIRDREKMFLFYTVDHEQVVVRSTSVESFPTGWGPGEEVFGPVHEAVHVYRAREKDEFHLLYEMRGEDGARRFGLATAPSPRGPWERSTNAYATGDQLRYWEGRPRWTEEVSHGEFIRSGSDAFLEYDAERPCLLIQGINLADHHEDYPNLVWSLGALTLEKKTIPPNFERKTFKDEYGTLSCLHRPGEGLPLVLIPGTFSDATRWNDVVAYLPPDLPIVLVDMRGHGGSWPPRPESSIEELAQDTLWLLDRMGIEKAYFGGHSLGGMISKEIGRAAPERTLAVLSVEGWTNYKCAKEAFASDMQSTLSPDQRKERAARRIRVESVWGREAMLEFATAWRKWDGLEFMETTDLSIIEFYGDRGRARPTREAMYIPDRENIDLVWFPGASHGLTDERPKELAGEIAKFLAGLNSER